MSSNPIEIVVAELVYNPSEEQRKLKSAFWLRFNDAPYCDPRSITLAVAQKLVPDKRLDRWWSINGFREWFSNAEEWRERAENLAHLALNAIEQVLRSDDPKAVNAKVNAAKLVLEATSKMPHKGIKEVYVDDKIGKMNRNQLEEYIRRNTLAISDSTTTNIVDKSGVDSSNS